MVSRRINGDEVAHGEVSQVTYDRPYRTYYNRYGVSARMPADPTQMSLFMEAGWSLTPPVTPLEKPKTQVMRNGSIFELESTTSDLSDQEKARLSRIPGQVVSNAGPTATYYTAEGTAIPNLPADPQSMADYLKSGLTLNPPAGEAEPS